MAIFDTANNPISSFSLSLNSAEVKTLTIRVECRTGRFLRCETVADIAVEARKVGDTTWINLETTPIDLSPFDATRQNFEIRLTAVSVIVLTRRNFKLTVGM